MGETINIPRDQTFQKMNELLAVIASQAGGVAPKTPADLQALVRNNLHRIVQVGDRITVERLGSVTASIGDSTGISGVAVDQDAFLAAMQGTHAGLYEASYDGAAWLKEDGTHINLADYGITVTGQAVEGDHIVINESTTAIPFNVLDHDTHTPVDPALSHTLALESGVVNTYGTIPFSAPQLLYWSENGMAAGNYKFTLDHGAYGGGTGQDGTYMFAITQPIAADGGFRHSAVGVYEDGGYTKAQILSGTITTYDGDRTAAKESGIAVYEWDGVTICTDLGTFSARSAQYSTDTTAHNFTERCAYGSNRYIHSNLRQWANSGAKTGWWSRKNVFEMPPSASARNMSGFLYGLDEAFKKTICRVKVKTAIPDPDRVSGGATEDTTEDLVWPLSMTEVFGSANIGVMEGKQMGFYKDRPAALRIIYQGETARWRFLRGPCPGYANYVRGVGTSGVLNYYRAYVTGAFVLGLCVG